jgi:hypothetical protein
MADQPAGQEPVGLDIDALTPVVRAAVGSDTASVTDWSVAPLRSDDVHFGGGKLFVVSGTAIDLGSTRRWSVVLKPVAREDDARAMDASDRADDYAFWKREPLAYASGVLRDMPGGIVGPACYGVVERSPDLYWIWLEHITDALPWTLERYGTVGRHLGSFNGGCLAGTPMPAVEWAASTRSIQSYWGASHPFMRPALELLRTPATWHRNEVRQAVDPLELHALAAFFADEDRYIGALAALPQTFCHNDALRPNLFARRADGDERTVAVDWQVAGHGPIGAELAMLVAGSVLFFKVPAADVEEVAERAWAGYLAGLEAAGCAFDSDEVRFGFAASVTARCGLLAAVWLRNALEDPEWVARVWGRPATEVVFQNALLAAFLDRRAAEAHRLLGA